VSTTDLIADMLTRIRNASRAKKEAVEIKHSKVIEAIVTILKNESFIANYKPITGKSFNTIKVYLKYSKDNTPALLDLKRISKPSLRVYNKNRKLPRVFGGIGIAIVSTSQGVMTADEARKRKIGGELICTAW